MEPVEKAWLRLAVLLAAAAIVPIAALEDEEEPFLPLPPTLPLPVLREPLLPVLSGLASPIPAPPPLALGPPPAPPDPLRAATPRSSEEPPSEEADDSSSGERRSLNACPTPPALPCPRADDDDDGPCWFSCCCSDCGEILFCCCCCCRACLWSEAGSEDKSDCARIESIPIATPPPPPLPLPLPPPDPAETLSGLIVPLRPKSASSPALFDSEKYWPSTRSA